jgi:hypothetical protein
VVLTAPTWRGQEPVPVADASLNAIPAGDHLAPMPVAGRGQSAAFAGHRVGEIVKATSQGGVVTFGLVRADGVASITRIQADLLAADPANVLGGAVVVSQAQLAVAPAPASLCGPATTRPRPAPPIWSTGERGGVCASSTERREPAAAHRARRPSDRGREDGRAECPADWVAVQPARGVDSAASVRSPSGLLGVVSDLGVLFPVPSAAVLAMLGYSGASPHVPPSALVALLPRGNALDPAAATAHARLNRVIQRRDHGVVRACTSPPGFAARIRKMPVWRHRPGRRVRCKLVQHIGRGRRHGGGVAAKFDSAQQSLRVSLSALMREVEAVRLEWVGRGGSSSDQVTRA